MILDILFIALAVGLAATLVGWTLIAGHRRGWEFGRARKRALLLALGFGGWLIVTAILGQRGAVFPAVIAMLALGLSSTIRDDLNVIPGRWPILLQTFRVLMEVILWFLFVSHVAPKEMTFEGRNMDILIGLTAPFVSHLFYTRSLLSRRSALIWNGLGILTLANVLAYGIVLSPPFVSRFPFVWLPAFVVPVAFFLHVISIRQLLRAPCWRDV